MIAVGLITSHWGEWLPQFLDGLWVAVKVAAGGLLLAIPLGLVLATGMHYGSRAVRWAAVIVVELGRGIPTLVLLLLIYDGLPQIHLTPTTYAAAIVALGFPTGCYASEIFRTSLRSVPAGQTEAAASLGMSPLSVFRHVTLPQGTRVALPALLGLSIIHFQGTALCFAIALPELMSKAYNAGSLTFDYTGAFVLAGVLYAAVVIPSSYLVRWLERRLDKGRPSGAPRRSKLDRLRESVDTGLVTPTIE
jgi:polar amino acid transport system permease protein